MRLNTTRGTKTAFLTLKRYDEPPLPFYMGVAIHGERFEVERIASSGILNP